MKDNQIRLRLSKTFHDLFFLLHFESQGKLISKEVSFEYNYLDQGKIAIILQEVARVLDAAVDGNWFLVRTCKLLTY